MLATNKTAVKISSAIVASVLLIFGFQNCGAAFQSLSSATGSTDLSSDILRAATARVKIPINSESFDSGTVRYSITLRIGNSGPIEALLDTGSSGLRVFANQIAIELAATASMGWGTKQSWGSECETSILRIHLLQWASIAGL